MTLASVLLVLLLDLPNPACFPPVPYHCDPPPRHPRYVRYVMATFQPPTLAEVPRVIEQDRAPWPRGPIHYRLFAHYAQLNRGQTLLLMSDGTVVNAGTFTPQTINYDVSQGNGDVWTEQGLAGLYYGPGILKGGTDGNPDIVRVFTGGHVFYINDAEVALLTAAGYADGISSQPYGFGGYGQGSYGG